jgi:hypothetical protein
MIVIIDEGRGQSIQFRLLKFIPGCVQRHYLKDNTLPLCGEEGGAGLCWRSYTAGFFLGMGTDSDTTKLLVRPKTKM